MQFERNEEKRRKNIRKHGFDFRDARKVFGSPVAHLTDPLNGGLRCASPTLQINPH